MEWFVKKGLSWKECNARMRIARGIFRWGVARELVPPTVLQGLQAVSGLKRGRTQAPETEPIKPAKFIHIEWSLPHLLSVVADAVEVLLLTGARFSEVLRLKVQDIIMEDNIWHSRLNEHQTANRGKERNLYYGPQARRF